MNNEAEREAFEAWCDDQCFHAQTEGRAAFQAGAAYQREQDKKLVEALEMYMRSFDLLLPYLSTVDPLNAARCIAIPALVAYRAQQEKPHD